MKFTCFSGWWFGTLILFLHILGIIIPTDQYFSEGLKPPITSFCYCRSNVCCTRNSSHDITTIFYVNGSCVTATYHIVQKIFAPFSILGLDEQSEWEYQNWVESEDVGYCWEFLGRCQERYELGPCTRLPSSSKARSGIFFPPGGVNDARCWTISTDCDLFGMFNSICFFCLIMVQSWKYIVSMICHVQVDKG